MTKLSLSCTFPRLHRPQAAILATAVLSLIIFSARPSPAQSYTVLHNFAGGQDGASPWGGLTMDVAGNLYGTAATGGSAANCQGGCGTVFKLSHSGSSWTFSPLYIFSKTDGAYPEGRLIFGHDGRLYGTTGQGGMGCDTTGCGVVFAMRPPATFCQSVLCFWTEQVLYQFTGADDGSRPTGDTVFDSAGNFYGTTFNGGAGGLGTVYELSLSGGNWSENTLHGFNGMDGANPYGGLALDSAGNLYGPTRVGGTLNLGAIFELSNTGSGWSEQVLYSFNGTDGNRPLGGLVVDRSGNVYGTTNRGGSNGLGGKVFALTFSGGSWSYAPLYSFTGSSGPWGDLIMDSAGNIYGTTVQDGAHDFGSVFKLTFSGGNWIYSTLHDFTGQDGALPHGSLVLDASGNLYGTTTAGGPHNLGVAWEITP
jgi:uncharacterized repeat protein (TIGR03803 family)